MTDPTPPQVEVLPPPEDPDRRLGSLALVAIAVGAFAALGAAIGWWRSGSYGTASAVSSWTLLAAPLLLGFLAGFYRPKRPMASALKLALLANVVAAPALGEGLLCLIVVLPWNLILTPLIALLVAWVKRRLGSRASGLLLLLPLPYLLPALDRHRGEDALPLVELQDSVVVDAPIGQVWSSLEALQLTFEEPPPWMVQLGLPRPLAVDGGGASVGAIRRVVFHNGIVVARVTRAEAPSTFDVDLTLEGAGREFFDHWSMLVDSQFSLEAVEGGRTRVTHRTRYRALTSPRWYFEPVERLGGRAVQRYMLEAYGRQLQQAKASGPAVSRR